MLEILSLVSEGGTSAYTSTCDKNLECLAISSSKGPLRGNEALKLSNKFAASAIHAQAVPLTGQISSRVAQRQMNDTDSRVDSASNRRLVSIVLIPLPIRSEQR